jgi:NAD(P)-dependent dehydrogenase (short-subunit alcohol dehydrogenase family)
MKTSTTTSTPPSRPPQHPRLHNPGKSSSSPAGIGRAVALQYAHAGVATIILIARSAPKLEEVAAEIGKIDAKIRVCHFALSVVDSDAVHKCAEQVAKEEGRLDVLINNAGGSDDWVGLVESKPEDWWGCLELNVKGPYLFLHAFLPLMAKTAQEVKGPAHVVSMSSIAQNLVRPGASAYMVSKLALARLTEFVQAEWAEKGIEVVAMHPGGVATELTAREESLKPHCIDTPELAGGACVWYTAEARTWLCGRYLAATWDVEALEKMKNEIVKEDKLKVRMVV